MGEVLNLLDEMAFSCECGSVKFSLLRSGGIECSSCKKRYANLFWGECKDK
jgi:hypothetical protein